MGNCIGTAFASYHNGKKVIPDEEFQVPAIVDQKLSSGPELCSAMLKSGDICRIIPQLIPQHGLKATAENFIDQRVKIVVTKQQFQLLIKNAEEKLKLRMGNRGRKWRPSLATIPEL